MTRSLLVAVVALCVGLVPATAEAAKRPSCYRYGGTTEVQSPKVRIFFKYHEYDDGARYYGCLRHVGKRVFLDDASTSQTYGSGPDLFRLHGRLVAWTGSACGLEVCSLYSLTVDLQSRKKIRSYAYGPQDVDSYPVDLQLAPSGSFGLMQAARPNPQLQPGVPYTYSVISVTAEGSTVLDSGMDIDKSSLAIGGRWLYWTRAGQPRSAELR
jgi:hypothetical protein